MFRRSAERKTRGGEGRHKESGLCVGRRNSERSKERERERGGWRTVWPQPRYSIVVATDAWIVNDLADLFYIVMRECNRNYLFNENIASV